jgi:serine/threonine-protein kinase RsbW
MTTIYELILESELNEVRRVEGFVNQICREHKFEKLFVHDVMLIITEATNNAILHGNKLDKSKRAILKCEIQNDEMLIMVHDEGGGFNPETLPNPLAEENLLKPSGRGVFLMKQFASDVKYTFAPSGTTLNIRVKIRNAKESECKD